MTARWSSAAAAVRTASLFIPCMDAGECITFTEVWVVRYSFAVSKISHHAALGAEDLSDPASGLLLFVKKDNLYLLLHCAAA